MKKKKLFILGDYLLLIMLVAISGFPLFRDPIYIAFYFIYILVYIFIRKKATLLFSFTKRELIIMYIFLVISCLHAVIYEGFISFSYFVLFVKVLIAVLILKYLQYNFIVYYCKILKWLCISSLFFWSLFVIFPLLVPLAFKLGIDVTYTTNDIDRSLIIYHLNPNSFSFFLVRNNGAFWEPGGFVLFIMTAILFTFIREGKINYKNISIYIITLITTFSTAGYLALLSFILLNYILVKRNYVYSLLFVLIFAYGYYNIEFLADKVQNEITYTEQKGSQNFRSRYGSFDLDLKVFSTSPLIGRGYSAERFDYKIYGVLNEENSGSISSPTDFLARFGLIGFSVYFFSLFYSFSVLSKSRKDALVCLIVFLIIGFSQSCYFLPFFLTIPFLYIIKNK